MVFLSKLDVTEEWPEDRGTLRFSVRAGRITIRVCFTALVRLGLAPSL